MSLTYHYLQYFHSNIPNIWYKIYSPMTLLQSMVKLYLENLFVQKWEANFDHQDTVCFVNQSERHLVHTESVCLIFLQFHNYLNQSAWPLLHDVEKNRWVYFIVYFSLSILSGSILPKNCLFLIYNIGNSKLEQFYLGW